jgi:probable rRNA maturation factor
MPDLSRVRRPRVQPGLSPDTSRRPVAVSNRHPRLRFERKAVIQVIHTLDAHHAELATTRSTLANLAELSVVFLTDAALAQLHDDFLDDPSITDVITFDGDPAFGSAGEICVSADAAIRHLTASAQGRRFAAERFARELTLYLVHGWLHLAGYDDLVPAKKRRMRRAETRAMALLEREHCLPRFRLI